jgi:hypothetical protein
MGKKKEIKKTLKKRIVALKTADERFCFNNECEPSDYMLGKTQGFDDVLEIIENL